MEEIFFTPEELHLIADEKFFKAKARIMAKVRAQLDYLYMGLKEEPAIASLLTPKQFDTSISTIPSTSAVTSNLHTGLSSGGGTTSSSR